MDGDSGEDGDGGENVGRGGVLMWTGVGVGEGKGSGIVRFQKWMIIDHL